MPKYESNRFSRRQEQEKISEPVVVERESVQDTVVSSAQTYNVNRNNVKMGRPKKSYKTITKNFRVVESVFKEGERDFKIKQLDDIISSKMSMGMYISDLIYKDLHNGDPLFDYKTGELLADIE